MESIFHEKQEGSLCAQHCLNALLQGCYFTAIELADIARQLDESERQHMAEGGLHSSEYTTFLQQPSSNFDDSGFFSIQVLQRALSIWGLDLLAFKSSDHIAEQARQDPTKQSAYICNFKEHWFTIRQLGNQWFNCNSLLTGPELISNTYLSLFLTQLQQEGYDIFIVLGSLPHSEADDLLRLVPAVQTVKPRLLTETAQTSSSSSAVNDADLQRALKESIASSTDENEQQLLSKTLQQSRSDAEGSHWENTEQEQLNAALVSSMQGLSSIVVPGTSSSPAPSAEEVRSKRLAFLERLETGKTPSDLEKVPTDNEKSPCDAVKAPSELTEEEMLEQAIQMSMQSGES